MKTYHNISKIKACYGMNLYFVLCIYNNICQHYHKDIQPWCMYSISPILIDIIIVNISYQFDNYVLINICIFCSYNLIKTADTKLYCSLKNCYTDYINYTIANPLIHTVVSFTSVHTTKVKTHIAVTCHQTHLLSMWFLFTWSNKVFLSSELAMHYHHIQWLTSWLCF